MVLPAPTEACLLQPIHTPPRACGGAERPLDAYKIGHRPAKLGPVATAIAGGHRSDGTISYSENLQEISREIQDGPELGFKPVMTSAAKRPATCCGTPFKPVHS